MLVPRSFSYASRTEKKERQRDGEKREESSQDRQRGFGWRPASYGRHAPLVDAAAPEPRTAIIPTPCSASARPTSEHDDHYEDERPDGVAKIWGKDVKEHTRTKPVAVPRRRTSHDRGPPPTSLEPTGRSGSKHDPSAMPPSMAALLAMTSIPKRSSFRNPRSTSSLPRRYSSQQLMDDWNQNAFEEESSLGTSPTMSILLSPPDLDDGLSRSSSSDAFDEFLGARSLSAESVPSLTTDDRSSPSSRAADSPRLSRNSQKEKTFSLPTSLDNAYDHPLSFKDSSPLDDMEGTDSDGSVQCGSPGSITPKNRSQRRSSNFKSNLTASLSALRSSLRSISNFASSPYTLPEDHLTRGLFAESQLIHREMRPRPTDRPPSAEMRRYLNPSAYHSSPHSDFHNHDRHHEHPDLEHIPNVPAPRDDSGEGSLIALQERTDNALAPLVPADAHRDASMTEAGRAMSEPNQQYRRELRENSEWLRICVLETNMRRAGKIEGPGHAQIWLPARYSAQDDRSSTEIEGGKAPIPQRWVAIYA